METIDLDFIVKTLEKGRCVLLLGPQAVLDQQGFPMQEDFLDYIDYPQNANIASYYPNDGLFLFPSGRERTRICYAVDEFYSQPAQKGFFEQLAQLPFHLCLSISPSLYLPKVFEKYQLPHNFQYYRYGENPKEVDLPSAEVPLIYNLFGSIEEEQSLILSHSDLYNFLFAILGDKQLPANLRDTLAQADNFLFIGFEFERWYVQILLRLLNLHLDHIDRYAINHALANDTVQFCETQFNITFVQQQVKDFVQDLYGKCEIKGILRRLEGQQTKPSAHITSLLEADELEKALAVAKDFFKSRDEGLYGEVIGLTSRYKRFARNQAKGVLNEENARVELAQISDAMMSLVREIESMED